MSVEVPGRFPDELVKPLSQMLPDLGKPPHPHAPQLGLEPAAEQLDGVELRGA